MAENFDVDQARIQSKYVKVFSAFGGIDISKIYPVTICKRELKMNRDDLMNLHSDQLSSQMRNGNHNEAIAKR